MRKPFICHGVCNAMASTVCLVSVELADAQCTCQIAKSSAYRQGMQLELVNEFYWARITGSPVDQQTWLILGEESSKFVQL